METFYKQLLDNNKKWVESKLNQDPDFFKKLSSGQKPPVLWIGCADSRVPANEIIGERFFAVLDLSKNDYVDLREFVHGFFKVYYSNLETKIKLSFDVYVMFFSFFLPS